MKIRVFALLLALLLLTGCGMSATVKQLDAAEDRIEDRLDAVEDQIEAAMEAPVKTAATEPALTEDEAIAIALEHAGLTEDQITGLRVRYEIDDRVPEYEIEFRQDRIEYDYTIHADTGEILSFDQDD